MTENEFPLDEVLQLQADFVDLYRATGLIAVVDNYVQVNAPALAELAEPTTWSVWKCASTKEEDFVFQASVRIQGVKFLAVLDEDELAEYGLEVPSA